MRRSLAVLAVGLTAVAVPFVGATGIVHAAAGRVHRHRRGQPGGQPAGLAHRHQRRCPTAARWFSEKAGAVRVLQADGTLAAADALQLSVCTASEEGLLGAAPTRRSPPTASSTCTTRATPATAPARRAGSTGSHASRCPATRSTRRASWSSSTTWPSPPATTTAATCTSAATATCTSPSATAVSRHAVAHQDLSILNGKILRITTAGGVPADNPFVGAANAQSCATAGLTQPDQRGVHGDLRLRPAQPVPLRLRPEQRQHPVLHQRRRRRHLGGGRPRHQGGELRLAHP